MADKSEGSYVIPEKRLVFEKLVVGLDSPLVRFQLLSVGSPAWRRRPHQASRHDYDQ